MKKYTYTNMRTELSDILDKLRLGESVIITQRGKEDLILQGSLANITALDEETFPTNLSCSLEFKQPLHSKKESEELSGINHIYKLLQSDGFKQVNRIMQSHGFKFLQEVMLSPAFQNTEIAMKEIQRVMPSLSPRFIEALTLTRIKHADTIKKLEDK